MQVNGEAETGNDDQVQQFDALFNFATIGIVVKDQNGRIINFNKCAEIQFRYSREEILGKAVEELIPNKYQSSHVKQRTIITIIQSHVAWAPGGIFTQKERTIPYSLLK